VTPRRFRALMLTAAIALRPAAAGAALVLISVPEEIAMGRQAQTAMAARTPRLASAEIQAYVSQIGHRLATSAGGPGFSYSFDVANLPDVNAFALPGGHIWVYRGALAVSRSESELAGVLAHEVAHVLERHAARQASAAMVAGVGLELLSALLGNTGGAVTSGLAANALTGSVFLAFSREDELVADREGTRILRKAGWDPDGLASFLETARAAARKNPTALEVFFSTHPATDDRIAALRRTKTNHGSLRRDSAEFAAMKKRLSALPPPPKQSTAGATHRPN
jgi:beta-barrel assembly-enhancing protease